MDRSLFHEANWIYLLIKKEEEKKEKLLNIKDQIVEILKGHIEIPEEELFDVFTKIKKLSEYIEKDIQKAYKQIDNL